jgi:hypothetical protein
MTASFGDRSNRSNCSHAMSGTFSEYISEADDILSSQGPIVDVEVKDF